MRKLTDVQRDFLKWLSTQPNHESEWTRNGKCTSRGPEHWTHLKVSGPTSSWLIGKEQLAGIHDLYGPAEFGSGNIFAVNDAGRAALADQEKGESAPTPFTSTTARGRDHAG